MRRTHTKISIALAFATLALTATTAFGADHVDSPAVSTEPTADITDLYAWMTPEADKLNLILSVHAFATTETAFSDAVVYAFHINSSDAYGNPQTETQILCKFADAKNVECWVGGEYVAGDASNPSGITSNSNALRVFAGLRDDPFFFEFAGFNETVNTVVSAAGGLTFDEAGCPAVDEATSAALVSSLQSGTNGAAASDALAGGNVLSLIVQIDKSLVNSGGPILGVWGSTHTIR